ncbi:MAG: FAD-dependent oxidoreductase [bacterium]|nr:FAD-dependent oxidoreductase [bacterium]
MRLAIIGAGITGLYLAWKSAEKGEDVTVFEKREKIGKEACSGLFSDRILEFIPQSKNLIKNKIDYTLINFPGKTLKIRFSRPFFVMSHSELDSLVADLAQKAGAKIILNSSALPAGFDRIIGCDGALSQTRKGLGLEDPEFYSGVQGFIQKNDSSNYVETWPTKAGFIWKIPRGGEVEYGIMEKPETAKAVFDQFLRKNSLNLEGIKSALIPQGLIMPNNPAITLCGDAAGLTKPWSGGGVIWGLTAADLLLKNFPDFIRYQKELKSLFLPKIIISKLAKSLIYFFGFNLPWALPENYKIESDFLI